MNGRARQPIPIITAPEPLPTSPRGIEAPGPASVDAWRPADPVAHVESMSIIELVAMDLADLVEDPSYEWISVSLPWSDAAINALLDAGGHVERAFSTTGYFAHVTAQRRGIRFYIVGAKLYGPPTLDEERRAIHFIRGERAAAVKADESVGWGCEATIGEVVS